TNAELLRITAEDDYRHGIVQRVIYLAGIDPVGRDEEGPAPKQSARLELGWQLAPVEHLQGRIAAREQAWREDAAETGTRVRADEDGESHHCGRAGHAPAPQPRCADASLRPVAEHGKEHQPARHLPVWQPDGAPQRYEGEHHYRGQCETEAVPVALICGAGAPRLPGGNHQREENPRQQPQRLPGNGAKYIFTVK